MRQPRAAHINVTIKELPQQRQHSQNRDGHQRGDRERCVADREEPDEQDQHERTFDGIAEHEQLSR